MVEKPLVVVNYQVVMTQAPTLKLNCVHAMIEMVLSFLERSLCVGVEKRIVVGIPSKL